MQHSAQKCAEESGFAGCLPHNIEAEQGLLGAILINNEAHGLVARLVEPEHFFESIHSEIYAIADDLIRAGKLATPITLKDYIPADRDIAGLSLDQYLARLCAEATTVINAPDYAKTICDLAHRRTLMTIAAELLAVASELSRRFFARHARPADDRAPRRNRDGAHRDARCPHFDRRRRGAGGQSNVCSHGARWRDRRHHHGP